jgi:hypothetical protein
MKRKESLTRCCLAGLVAIVVTIAGSRTASAQPSPVPAILAVLKDSITKGGEATRLVAPPVRSYQRPLVDGAVAALGAMLGLAAPLDAAKPRSCRRAPVDSTAIGMDITVTEFEVTGDSAKVSVQRRCVRMQGGRGTYYLSEPTWFLQRRDGRWVVTTTWLSVTLGPSGSGGLEVERTRPV